MLRVLTLTAAAAALAAAAHADPAPYVARLTDPVWAKAPTYHDMIEATPAKAIAWQRKGEADVKCRVGAGGLLTDCSLALQTHRDFATAAMRATPKFRMKPAAEGGIPEGEWVLIPFLFEFHMR